MDPIAAVPNVDPTSWSIPGRIGIAAFWWVAMPLGFAGPALAATPETLHLSVLSARQTDSWDLTVGLDVGDVDLLQF